MKISSVGNGNLKMEIVIWEWERMEITNLFLETSSYKRQLMVEMSLVTPSSSIC